MNPIAESLQPERHQYHREPNRTLNYTITLFFFFSKVTKLQVSEGSSTNRVEVQVARMVVVMVLAFLLTWLPYAAMALAIILDSSLYINPLIATVPVFLAKSSTVYNPIIYVFMNRQVCVILTPQKKEKKIFRH